jgi:hypothetical protein
MINIFQQSYDTRLKSWYQLRTSIEKLDIKEKCIEIDRYWQRAPLVNHYLHFDFMEEWPNPWELIYENNYCNVARALGMVYTLLLLGIKDIEVVEAIDYNNEEVVLVLVDNAKYILNYWPDTVLNNNLHDFKINKKINISPIITKIG